MILCVPLKKLEKLNFRGFKEEISTPNFGKDSEKGIRMY